ncbi:ribosomal protein S12 methylthiotransferase accessory factor [Halarchaeum rubridurum]|uniref:Bacteriocin biosynthesis protein SagD n=1 Tax=Halarchaeum rubridurum TaxID=489911 RepID=A0A830FWR9_9EURY|nr:YcaO-like family protein [Halarchaeum rubridurum]MBP1953710.1 ribosomal protein S12 methylthiotransferase accessory factor [Halarchaeum rubridurum]GGM54067.1 bacteriocin biosynthesis protein SagD [Halarchaeum rubridurum]
MTRTYAVAGSGAAADATTAALDDAGLTAAGTDGGLDAIPDADVAVVVGLAGSDGFAAANARARRSETPWLAVEVGGVGGHPIADVDAAVGAFTPDSGCFACLERRVAAADPETTAEPSAARSSVRYAGALAGKRALDLLDGAATGGTVVEVPHAERSFAPAPFCDCAPVERYGDPGREGDETPLDAAAAKAEHAVDGRVGIITEVGERETYPVPYYLATTCDTAALGGTEHRGLAAGVGLDWDAAFVKAVGEGLERYCAAAYREGDVELAKPTHPDALAPDAFVRPDDAPAVTRDDPLRFVPGVALTDGSDALLPAEYVHFPPPEETNRPALTTGLGLGNDPAEALRSGLYETIERDATMLAWYSTFDPLEVTVDDDAYETLARRAGAEGLDVTALLCTADVDVPVLAVAVHREDDWPRFALGSAANLDAVAAARGALCEAIQNWIELRDMGRERAADEQGAIGDYAALPREARDFLDADATVAAADLGPDSVPDGTAELDAVVERAADAGLDTYATDITTRDVADVGFRAVRVLAPDAQPLFFDDAYFGARARDVPEQLGFEARLDRRHHPFP